MRRGERERGRSCDIGRGGNRTCQGRGAYGYIDAVRRIETNPEITYPNARLQAILAAAPSFSNVRWIGFICKC